MKLKLNKTSLLILISIFTISCGSMHINTNPYWQGKIMLKDSTIKKGYIMVPNSSKERLIAFKQTLNGEKENVKRKSIESLIVFQNEKSYLYENIPASLTVKSHTTFGTKLLLVVAKNDYVTFYIESEVYKMNENTGEITLIDYYSPMGDFASVTYYIRKRGVPNANMLYTTNYIGGIKRGANYHLSEDKKLLKRINNGELTRNDIPEIIKTYIATTNGM